MLKKISYALSLGIAIFVMTSGMVVAQMQKISDADRTLLIDTLNANSERFKKAITGLSAEQLNFKPTPEKWSILECAEHLTEAEPFLFDMITTKVLTTAPVESKGGAADAQITAMVTDRSTKFQAPEPLKPSGKWKTVDATIAEFEKRRDNTIKFVKTTTTPLRSHLYGFTEANKWDGVQWFIFMSGHVDRHIAQINEVKANPNFPKK